MDGRNIVAETPWEALLEQASEEIGVARYDCSDVIVIKKDGTEHPWSDEKLLEAVNKSAARARGIDIYKQTSGKLTEKETAMFLYRVKKKVDDRRADRDGRRKITTEALHTDVENALKEVAYDVFEAYFTYHSEAKNKAKAYEKIIADCNEAGANGDKQNANADSTLASTLKCLSADYLETSRYENYFMTKEEKGISDEGELYFHDRNGRNLYPNNCGLTRVGYVMEHGFEANGVVYNRPKSLDVAFDVMGDVILMGASQQYGGFTVPRVDSILAPYAQMSYEKAVEKYVELGINREKAEEIAAKEIEDTMYQGFQGLEIKLNTVASSRGDYPFTTFTFGLDTTRWGRLASIAALNVRAGGQGTPGKKKPVMFPKLVFLYDENLHGPGKELEDVFEAGIACSAKAMYPDWLSLTGEGYISSMYKKYGTDGVISPMGCRAFLSPWYERGGMEPADENDKPVFEGRFNIGVISLNLPMMLAKARKEGRDFYEVLDYYLEVVRQCHLRTYAYIGQMKASRNPMGFCYGGFYGGHLKPEDNIEPVLKSATASFGITALNELQQLYNGKSIYEDGEFALEVMRHINDKVAEFKKQDGRLYAIYGTPAESLCGKQVQQFRKLYGVVKNVSDREYVSNSFHCHVTENITPIQKQDSEYRFWELFNGGKIQYCRYQNSYNTDAIRTLVRRAMKMGFYEGVNLALNYCDDCGFQSNDIGDVCPKCGGIHITTIDRMNGYLGYSRQGKYSRLADDGKHIIYQGRFNAAKAAEISERVSM